MSDQAMQDRNPPPRWRRRVREKIRMLVFHLGHPWRRYGYRPAMRVAHRFGWHYAPSHHVLTNDAGWPLCRCEWCGLAGFALPTKKRHE